MTQKRLRWTVGFAIFAVLLAAVWLGLKKKFDVNQAPSSYGFVDRFERDGVPELQALDLEGRPISLSMFKQPILIVNFWASWCSPCVEEFPSMLKLVETMKGKVAIIAVSLDEEEKDLRAFAKLFKVPREGFAVAWDRSYKDRDAYGVGKLPESYIAGPDRKLVRKVLGIENWASPSAIQYFEEMAATSRR